MRVLVVSTAYAGALVAVVQDGEVLAEGRCGERGLAAALPGLVSGLLERAHADCVSPTRPPFCLSSSLIVQTGCNLGDAALANRAAPVGLVAVVVGPGSFTGLRAGLSVALGVGLGSGVPVIGVTVAEALGAELGASSSAPSPGRDVWTAVHARPGRVFVDRAGGLSAYAIDALPPAFGPVAVCGNAANLVAGTLAARGTDVMLTAFRLPGPIHVAAVALARQAGALPPLPVLPAYVDLPEATPKAGRPAPANAATA